MEVAVGAKPNLDEAINKFELLVAGIFQHTQRAVSISASFVLKTWVNIAQGNDLSSKPQGVSFTGSIDYANSIKIKSISPLGKEIFSDSDIGAKLEEGAKAYDMKPALVGGPKSRVNKAGDRYNIIPLRQKVKALMSQKVGGQNAYSVAKALTQQTITGSKIDTEGKKRLAYSKWTSNKILKGGGAGALQGLVRMKSGAGNRSQYMTFRIVKLSQVGKWIRKAQPAWKIVDEVNRLTQDKVQEFVSKAIARDLAGS